LRFGLRLQGMREFGAPNYTLLVGARARRADDLGERFLADLRDNWIRPASLPKLASNRRSRASCFSVELNSWSTGSSSTPA